MENNLQQNLLKFICFINFVLFKESVNRHNKIVLLVSEIQGVKVGNGGFALEFYRKIINGNILYVQMKFASSVSKNSPIDTLVRKLNK